MGDQKDDLHGSLAAVLGSTKPLHNYVEEQAHEGDMVAPDVLDVVIDMTADLDIDVDMDMD